MPLDIQDGLKILIGLAEFEPLRVAGLRSILETDPRIEILATDTRSVLAERSLSLVLFGLREEAPASFELLARIKSDHPSLKLMVVGSLRDDETIINAIAVGAKGYIEETASPELLLQAIQIVDSGSIWAPRRVLSLFVDRMLQFSAKPVRRHSVQFTEREQQVLRLLVAARSNREIAETLGIEERTVKAYVQKLMQKVGVDNRIALSVHAATSAFAHEE